MNLSNKLLKIFAAASGCAVAATSLHAATIEQSANSSNVVAGTWNSSSLWSNAAVPSEDNDYVSTVGTGPVLIYTINGIEWNQSSWSVQTTTTTNHSTSSTFGGNSLTLVGNTVLNDRAGGGSTQTVNLVFDGGFYRGNNGNSGNQSSTLAGTVGFATGTTMAAMGTGITSSSTGNFSFTLNSTIVGGVGNTLQLTMNGGVNKAVLFNVNGDLSGYAGTLYLGVSSAGVQPFTGTGSAFSISSDAPSATVQFDTTTTNFHYDMGIGNATFGSLLYGDGEGTLLGAGVYDADSLNLLTGTTAFFGTGTITVVPEPSTTALGALALLGGVAMARYRRHRRRTA